MAMDSKGKLTKSKPNLCLPTKNLVIFEFTKPNWKVFLKHDVGSRAYFATCQWAKVNKGILFAGSAPVMDNCFTEHTH